LFATFAPIVSQAKGNGMSRDNLEREHQEAIAECAMAGDLAGVAEWLDWANDLADALNAAEQRVARRRRHEEGEPVIDWKEVSRQIYNAHPGIEKSDADRLADDAFDFAEHLNRVRSGGAL
jgi:hypothetical protein